MLATEGASTMARAARSAAPRLRLDGSSGRARVPDENATMQGASPLSRRTVIGKIRAYPARSITLARQALHPCFHGVVRQVEGPVENGPGGEQEKARCHGAEDRFDGGGSCGGVVVDAMLLQYPFHRRAEERSKGFNGAITAVRQVSQQEAERRGLTGEGGGGCRCRPSGIPARRLGQAEPDGGCELLGGPPQHRPVQLAFASEMIGNGAGVRAAGIADVADGSSAVSGTGEEFEPGVQEALTCGGSPSHTVVCII